jgi:hypothetical protein
MVGRIILGSTLGLVLAAPVSAGPCTQRIAELEKAVTAQQEGGEPALANPSTTGSTGQGSSGVNVTAQSQSSNQAMAMLQQAKQLDQQGKEAECMDLTNRASAMAPPTTK